jgi:hypothetical protein
MFDGIDIESDRHFDGSRSRYVHCNARTGSPSGIDRRP